MGLFILVVAIAAALVLIGVTVTAGSFATQESLVQQANSTDTTIGASTLTAAKMVTGVLTRSGSTAAYSDTTATAAELLAALGAANVGESFTLRILNTVAFAETLVGGTGVTLSGQTVIAGLHWADFLITITAATTATMYGFASGPICPLPAVKFTTDAAGTQTADAGDLTGAALTVWKNTASGAVALTTRTATLMFADIPNAQIGTTFLLRIISGGDNTVTLTAGTGVTITGTATVATTVVRDFTATFTSATAITFQNVGALAA